MNTRSKEIILVILVVLANVLRIDWWAWDKVYPFALNVAPYHVWYIFLMGLLIAVIFIWWSVWGWPKPPAKYL